MKIYKIPLFYSLFSLVLMASMMQTALAEIEYRVRYGDNLDRIVAEFYPYRTLTKKQIMVSVFNKNLDAFNAGNIHFLLRGKKLILPDETEIIAVTPEDASALILAHAEQQRDDASVAEDAAETAQKQSALRDEMDANQKKQTQKIHQLENESEALRQRLEQLLDAKDKRENKLIELEAAIKKSLEKPSVSFSTDGMSREEIIRTQRLKEKNEILQKKLQESRSALAENARSTISLKRRLNDLKSSPKQDETVTAVKSEKTQSSVNQSSANMAESFDLSSKAIWLIPLFLLAGFWYLFNWMKKNKRKTNISYDDDISSIKDIYLEANEEFDPNYEEESLEAGIKIDVANAYLEAGDIASAQGVLREVLKEGSSAQKEMAQGLLDTL